MTTTPPIDAPRPIMVGPPTKHQLALMIWVVRFSHQSDAWDW